MIKVRGLKKTLRSQIVLNGLDIDLPEGQTMVIIGQSGTGKSVFLKHLIGLMRPDSGTIEVDGERVENLKEREWTPVRQKFGMLFQGAALFDSMSVFDNVAFPLRERRGVEEDEIGERVMHALSLVDLEGSEAKYPAELSGGMRKRVGLARAIVGEPEYLLYDEPTTGLDPVTADTINELILRLRSSLNVTSIAVTHDMASAYKIGDRIVMLYGGKNYFEGTIEETKEAEDPIVHQFINGQAKGPLTKKGAG
jgi:phospholipid/cholesterol/gamma-HCH transport system ATP-binding protein